MSVQTRLAVLLFGFALSVRSVAAGTPSFAPLPWTSLAEARSDVSRNGADAILAQEQIRRTQVNTAAPCNAADSFDLYAQLANANCAVINLAQGTYNVNATINRAVTIQGSNFQNTIIKPETSTSFAPIFTVNALLASAGPTDGTSTPPGAGVVFRNLTIQDGKASHGAAILNLGAYVTLDTCLLQNNSAERDLPGSGGAIDNEGYGFLVIDNSRLVKNKASVNGGAISSGKVGNPTVVIIRNSRLDQNSATLAGGAIHNDIGFLYIADSELDHNSIDATLGCFGGAINNTIGYTFIKRSKFHDNLVKATTYVAAGGAIATTGSLTAGTGLVDVEDSVFEDNEARAFLLASGGAVTVLAAGKLNARRTIFRRNRSGGGGAIDNQAKGFVELDGCLLTRNEVDGKVSAFGGAIRNDASTVEIRNSTITHNRTNGFGNGGAIYNKIEAGVVDPGAGVTFTARVFIKNSTIAYNVATKFVSFGGFGGAIYSEATGVARATVEIFNSTIAGNEADTAATSIYTNGAAPAIAEVIVGNSILYSGRPIALWLLQGVNCLPVGVPGEVRIESRGYNVVDDDTCFLAFPGPSDQTNVDPKLGPLGDWGGGTPTINLRADSPAIDAGNSATPTADGSNNTCLDKDQRGIARPQEARCDSGALEYAHFNILTLEPQGNGPPANTPVRQTFDRPPATPIPAGGVAVHSRYQGLVSGTTDLVQLDATHHRLTLQPASPLFINDNVRVSVTNKLIKTAGAIPLQNPAQYSFTTKGAASCIGSFAGVQSLGVGSLERAMAFGDYDRDGDLDLFLGGVLDSEIYRNNGGNFAALNAGLPDLYNSAVAWGDIDNDGDLDLALQGRESGVKLVTEIYRNTNGAFTSMDAGMRGLEYGSIDFGDYDNDGDLDVLVTGLDVNRNRFTDIYANDALVFRRIRASVAQVAYGDAKFGDYDLDGDLDVAVVGSTGTQAITEIYRNDRIDVFVAQMTTATGLRDASLAWGDLDGDNDLDLVVAGETPQGTATTLVFARGTSAFALVATALPNSTRGTVALGDYDGDGDLDVLLTGHQPGSGPTTEIYRNNGAFSFVAVKAALKGLTDSVAAWGDWDNDGDLDLAQAGWEGSSWFNRIYRSAGCVVTNDTYTMPSGGSLAVPAPGVLTNDKIVGAVTVAAVTTPSEGTFNLASNGSFTFTPPPGVHGTYTFTYRATSNGVNTGTATATIIVEPVGTCRAQVDGSSFVYVSGDAAAVQAAVDAATSGGTVKVAGTCAGVVTKGGANQTVYIDKSLTLQGGYSPTSFATLDPVTHKTTLDALGGGRVVMIPTTASGTPSITLRNLVIQNGLASAINGGGIHHGKGTLAIDACDVRTNLATGGGHGAGLYAVANFNMTKSLLRSNSSASGSGNGGGIAMDGGTSTIRNSTIGENAAGTGGGVSVISGTLTINNATIANNAATTGGGIRRTTGTVTVSNTVLSGNSPGSCSGTVTSGNYNVTVDSTCGFAGTGDQQSADPLLLPLSANGGITMTYGLSGESPAINLGSDGTPVICETTDQRGVTRANRCDAGAFETSFSPLTTCKARLGSTDYPGPGDTYTDGQAIVEALRDVTGAGATIKIAGYCKKPATSVLPDICITDEQRAMLEIRRNNITFEGGYDGTNWDTPDPAKYPTIIDGNDTYRIASICSSCAVGSGGFQLCDSGPRTVTFRYITFMKGKDNGSANNGGAIYNAQNVIIDSCTFLRNHAQSGGAIYATNIDDTSRSTTITNSTFIGNKSTLSSGGAIRFFSSIDGGITSTISNTVFSSNFAEGSGGAIWVDKSTGPVSVGITDSKFFNNSTDGNGGALHMSRISGSGTPSLTITGSRLSGNKATDSGRGGAIHVSTAGNLTITESTLDGNDATLSGGAIHFDGSSLTVERSTISGNGTVDDGGAIYHEDGTLTIRNSTLSGNKASDSGAAIRSLDTANITSTTFANNTGAGAFSAASSSQDNTLKNVLFSGNSSSCGSTNRLVSGGYNLAPDATCSTFTFTGDMLNANASIGSLADNGGPTETHLPLAANAGIDKGDCASLTVDQRNFARPNRDACDVGAVERFGTATTTSLTASSSTSVFGEPVTFSVEVSSDGGVPGGTVELRNGATLLTTLTLDGAGFATGSVSTVPVSASAQTITAKYLGDTTFDASQGTTSLTVSQGPTITNVFAEPAPSIVSSAIVVGASVVPVSPSSGSPTGQVVVSDGVDQCTITLGAATTCTLTLTTTGDRTLTATYSGETRFATSASSIVQPVLSPTRITTLNSLPATADNSVSPGEAIAPITDLLATFSQTMSDPSGSSTAGDVTNVANYQLVSAGSNGFQTTACGGVQAGDTAISISVVNYDAATGVARITVNDGPLLPEGSYRLFLCGSLLDFNGQSIDGNGDGAVGDAFVRDFTVDTQPTVPTTLESTTHTVNGWSKVRIIGVRWSGATDGALAGYSVLFDNNASTVPDTTVDVVQGTDPHTTSSSSLADGTWYFHLRACDATSNCTTALHLGPFRIDNVVPSDPPAANVQSTTHPAGTYSKQRQITVTWSGASDAGGAIGGYSVLFDNQPSTLPDNSIDVPHTSDPHSVTSSPLGDGTWYFHMRTCDAAANCTSTVHLGPFLIDGTPPTVPGSISSPSHTAGQTTLNRILQIAWSASTDSGGSGLAGYDIAFTSNATATLTGPADLGPGATTASSPPLLGGTWYAHVSAGDNAGNWSNVATFGPIEVDPAAIPTFSQATLMLLALALTALAFAAMRRAGM